MRNVRAAFSSVFFLLVLGSGSVTLGQQTTPTGTPPFSSVQKGTADVVNLSNLDVHVKIPVLHKAGRGIGLNVDLAYDNAVWQIVSTDNGNAWSPIYNSDGWNNLFFGPVMGLLYATVNPMSCGGSNEVTTYANWYYVDRTGTVHPFEVSTIEVTGTCSGYSTTSITALAVDGSGYTLHATGGAGTVTAPNGSIINPPAPFTHNGQIKSTGTLTDSNGNEISLSSTGVVTDTLGLTALAIGGGTGTTFTYTAPSGANAIYRVTYTGETIQTNFGCSGIQEYSNTDATVITEVELPDGTSYKFTYEPTPGNPNAITGRIASLSLPTGGEITYAYTGSNNGIECTDGSVAGINRTTPDGEWKYVRAGTAPAMTTTITDPLQNKTVVNFQGNFETERQVNTGSSTLLRTTYTCYNGNVTISTCNSTAVTPPIAERAFFTIWPGTNGLESETVYGYNSNGFLLEKDEHAYGAGAPGGIDRETITDYAVLGNGIINKPSYVEVTDGAGNVKAETFYCYDEATPSGTSTCGTTGSPTPTSGTPQHVAVTGSRGNATTIASLVTGSTTLGRKYTYYDTGNVNVATDVNGATTTYTYGSGTSCGNSFPTSVAEPLNLSRSMIWNCTGGVETSETDENAETASNSYDDPHFWRPETITDQESNVTSLTYTGQTSAEASLVFNSNGSTSDVLNNMDSLGRTHVSQMLELPGSTNYDSVETDYDSDGRPSKTSLPYKGTAGQTNASAPGTTTTYDGLGRKYQVTDSGGRTTTFSYDQNDTYLTLGPAPAGENPKRKQFEYNALGQLASVCEITSATGSGTCGQTASVTGYWTQYSYDLLNDLANVTQNGQTRHPIPQSRAYEYDDLRRLGYESNPESGSTHYTYDTDATCGTSTGDLVKKVDAVGNTICYKYDSLHRVTSVTYSGPYASTTPNRYFVYDTATVNGAAMVNAKSRLAEAYTATSATGTKITDIGLSYSPRGEISDVYEFTPNSGGYYHVSATYWPNGVLDTLTALYNSTSITGLPSFAYGPDGEGRTSTVSASSGTNPVTGTSYSVASLPTQVNFGSSDSDSFTYDPNTNRMTQYEFTVNGQNVIGQLTWNAIGTLEDLVVTDALYSGGNQSCAYSHDDLSRTASVNCGTIWGQNFTYDAFGNITKTVLSGSNGVAFQPTYSSATNHMTQVGSSTPTYDANGNATNDTAHTYTWDANGKSVTVDGIGLTYDALGRMVEQSQSGNYHQIVYAPTGGKFAIMSGATLQKAFVSLTGGSQAIYTSSGLAYYRHSDWVGSSRFASTPSRTLYYDGSYAPFGEPYAQTGTSDLSFTGMNQDTVANLYDFLARELNNIHGRWPSPDPAGTAAVGLKDPRTWNRYAYVRNNPLSLTDPIGMDDDDDGGGGGVGPGGGGLVDVDTGVDATWIYCSADCDNAIGSPAGASNSQNTCDSDTCQTATACNSQACQNQTVIIVNGNDGNQGTVNMAYGPNNPPWLPKNQINVRPPAKSYPKVDPPNVDPGPPNATEPPPNFEPAPPGPAWGPEPPINVPPNATILDRMILIMTQIAKALGGYGPAPSPVICLTCGTCQPVTKDCL